MEYFSTIGDVIVIANRAKPEETRPREKRMMSHNWIGSPKPRPWDASPLFLQYNQTHTITRIHEIKNSLTLVSSQ
jgi:hypothetical protein